MSADLWADFVASVEQDSSSSNNAPKANPAVQLHNNHDLDNNELEHDIHADDDFDDDFGDFQIAGHSHSGGSGAGSDVRSNEARGPKATRDVPKSSRVDISTSDDVLFDAVEPDRQSSHVEDTGSAIMEKLPGATRIEPVVNLIDLDDVPQPSSLPPARQSVSNPQSSTPRPRPVSFFALPSDRHAIQAEKEDDWDDFETSEPPSSAPTSDLISHLKIPSHITDIMTAKITNAASLLPPPAIPPPSVLLSLFPGIMTVVSTTFLQPFNHAQQQLAQQRSTASHSQIPPLSTSHPHSSDFLNAYDALLNVLVHILSGRKQRWKRDKLLSQAMSIGPSMAGGRSGGMKLAGVDRSESAREDHVAEEVVRVWRGHAGRLKVANASLSGSASGSGSGSAAVAVAVAVAGGSDVSAATTTTTTTRVPDLKTNMPVRVAKTAQGAVGSTTACGLCGLKREERVARVDDAVDDMFDEWWLQNPRMHTACWRFWEGYKEMLRSR